MSFWIVASILALSAAAPGGLEIPEGTDLEVRLTTKVASNASKPKEPVEAVVIFPVFMDEWSVIPAGTRLKGQVKEVKPAFKPDERACVHIEFSELQWGGDKPVKVSGRLKRVDNARESVDDTGRIVGILASETLSARMDAGLQKLAQRYAGLAGILSGAKGAMIRQAEGDIVYEPGVEMTFTLTKPVKWTSRLAGQEIPSIPEEEQLHRFVNSQPFQTTAQKPPKPSDMTNLMFLGSAEKVRAIFKEAGWVPAAALNSASAMETMRAVVENRGYKEAPMSILLLDGQKPDMDFQKQNNTFAMRHHLRIWGRQDRFLGRQAWLCAATHDTGIEFSPENRTFIHKIDSQIDKERAKVVGDLLFTGLLKGLALVERPDVPQRSRNATGDALETDGRMAVLLLE